MIAVYDMTSGTLRKELEARNNTTEEQAPAETQATGIALPELRLQEIEFSNTADAHTLPDHMAALEVEDFIKKMK